ncbi:ABC multidrug transporter [Purpureocillium lavendulum]|uniref:ABC multidrug transporter n=1 Tax=Purpureocillium lavendulum TaxID=1247861 RepID=A0AB34G363_9HYPO|nr:ABC multidrug transporter [Purpureocillium lavendulum]
MPEAPGLEPPTNASDCRDGLFGPKVWTDECRGGFDFTITFEESILAIAPSVILLLASFPRVLYLVRQRDKARRRSTYTPKLVTACLLLALHLGQLIAVALSGAKTAVSVVAAALNLIVACFIIVLFDVEHAKTIRPSFLLSAYLFTSVLFDATRLRTQWLVSTNVPFASLLSVSLMLKITLLVLENVNKRRALIGHAPSVESTSGPFNRGLFVWLNSLLISGWATVLTSSTLPTIYEKLSSEDLLRRFETRWTRASIRSRRPSLFIATIRILKWELLGIALPRLVIIGLTISQPFLISNALRFLSLPPTAATLNVGYGLIGAFGFVYVGSAIFKAWYEHLTARVDAMVRGGTIMLIYRKLLLLPSSNVAGSSAVTLMGNDVETLSEQLHFLLVESWANSITVALSIWMLSEQLGAVCVAPVLLALVTLITSSIIGKVIVARQTQYQRATQDRINFTSEVLASMKSVKMLGYAEHFTKLIKRKRENDINAGKHYRRATTLGNMISNGVESMSQALTFGAYAIATQLSGNQAFSAAQAITALSILNVLVDPLQELLRSIPQSFSALGCFKRVEEFLFLDERADGRIIQGPSSTESTDFGEPDGIALQGRHSSSHKPVSMSITTGKFGWNEKQVLSNLDLTFSSSSFGSLTIITGPIGCGKSTLLKGLLGETSFSAGHVSIASPNIAFCDQTPWVINATLRANIIGESRFSDEEAWLAEVIEACDLRTDFSQLPDGDLTVVGDSGVKLSGGQKQRLAIARAVYSRKPVALFDDVFSGLDKITEKTVFNRVFSQRGILRRIGTDIILVTHAVHLLPEADEIIILGNDGQVTDHGSYAVLRSTSPYIRSLDKSAEGKHDDEATAEEPNVVDNLATEMRSKKRAVEEQAPFSDRTTFKYYFDTIGPLSMGLAVFLTGSTGFLTTFRSVWVTWWGNGRGHDSTDLAYWLTIYALLAVSEATVITLAIGHFVLYIGPASGRILHSRLLKTVMEAPTALLSSIEVGSLVNRFSQDMRFIDIALPVSLVVFLFQSASSVGTLGLAVAAIPWIAISVPFIAVTLVIVQRFYVRTSKQLRLLDIEQKAPLYSHFLETMSGLPTVRAFGWTSQYADKALLLLDSAQKPSYLLSCIQRWLTLVLDLVVAALIVLLVALAVLLREKNTVDPSLLGVALVNMMYLGINLKNIVLQWSTLETSLGAVSRVKAFTENTPSENSASETGMLPPGWPVRGSLAVRDLTIQYDEVAGPVLRRVSFSVPHGTKLGLCGRSGSGKSSLIQAILRTVDISDGCILLGGEDISTLPRNEVRQSLNCLTQDPFLFTENVRFNADPRGDHADEDIIAALKRVGLWTAILDNADDGVAPLDAKMTHGSLSQGQKQLFCLGRALLNKSSFLILDEPTSSVDSQTDARIQEILRSEFKGCTIIMIAHRLETLLDFDCVVVLDKGLLVEKGNPLALLADKETRFAALYRADKTRRGV